MSGYHLRFFETVRLEDRVPAKVCRTSCRYDFTLINTVSERKHQQYRGHFNVTNRSLAFKDDRFVARTFAVGKSTKCVSRVIVESGQHFVEAVVSKGFQEPFTVNMGCE